MGRAGFEPAKSNDNRVTVCPRWPLEYLPIIGIINISKNASTALHASSQNNHLFDLKRTLKRADGGTRTHDLLITNQLL